MDSSDRYISEIIQSEIEGEFLLYILKGLLTHVERVQVKVRFFSDIFTPQDLENLEEALCGIHTYLSTILKGARIYKGTKVIKSTYV